MRHKVKLAEAANNLKANTRSLIDYIDSALQEDINYCPEFAETIISHIEMAVKTLKETKQ